MDGCAEENSVTGLYERNSGIVEGVCNTDL